MSSDTGYEGTEPVESEAPIEWRSKRLEHFASSSHILQILRNGRGVGVIYLDNTEDVEFIQQTFPPQESDDGAETKSTSAS